MPRLVSRGLNADEYATQRNGFSLHDFRDHEAGHLHYTNALNEQERHQKEPETSRSVEMPDEDITLKFEPDEIIKFKMIYNSFDRDGSKNVLLHISTK